MTLEREAEAEVFGLAGTFPRPGWVVLDAARDHRFTGELVFDLIPEIRVYLDRGQIYLAERAHDPSLGARLVDAGALSTVQRENGGMIVGDGEYLGRLFERVPSVDRHAVLITTEMMNDECVSWLARQQVRDVTTAPYQRHVSGLHRWEAVGDAHALSPGDPLPAPSITDAPVEVPPPASVFGDVTAFADGMIQWDEPSWLDERTTSLSGAEPESHVAASAPSTPEQPTIVPDLLLSSDWVDRLADVGLPEAGDDPLSAPAQLPARVTPSPDRFEIIWPSGDVDEDFGATSRAELEHHPDYDRAGPTVRIGGFESASARETAPTVSQFDATSLAPADPTVGASAIFREATDASIAAPTRPTDTADDPPADTADDVVLAVRRAVASIETDSLDARRLAEDPMPETAIVATPIDRPGGSYMPTSRSVFDDETVTPAPASETHEEIEVIEPTTVEPERVSALRRLIGGLRRR